MDSDKAPLPFSQRILTRESLFMTIVTVAWFGWLDALGLWIGILRPTGRFFPHDAIIFGFFITLALTLSICREGFRSRLSKWIAAFYIIGANLLLFHGGGVVNIFHPMSFTPIVIISTLLGTRWGVLYGIAQGAVFVLAVSPTLAVDIPGGLAKAYGITFSNFLWYIIAATLFGILGVAVRGLDASRKEIREKNEELLRLRLRLRQERQQIARDVHSSAIQKLYVAQMKADQAAKSLVKASQEETGKNKASKGEAGKDTAKDTERLLADITRLVNEAISQLRTLVLERHTQQGNESFIALLEATVKEVETMARQAAQLEISPSVYQADRVGDLGPETATGALEIAKEAIINAIKHAEASQIRVKITIQERMLRIIVQDNGKGFTMKNLFTFAMRKNFGLYDMRRRCQELGGRLRISSELGRGTCVEVLLPLAASQKPPDSSRYPASFQKMFE